MLLRIFNDDTPLINTTNKQQRKVDSTSTPETPVTETPLEPTAEAEDSALKHENEQLGQDEQEHMDMRETWTKAGDEEDRFNTTV